MARNPLDETFDEIQALANKSSNSGYISKDEVTQQTGLNYRTTDFYVRLKLLKRPKKINKEVYWQRDYILDELKAIKILNTKFGYSLSRIAEYAKATKFNLAQTTNDILVIIEDFIRKTIKPYRKKGLQWARLEDDISFSERIWRKYFHLVKRGKFKTPSQQQNFIRFIDDNYTPVIRLLLKFDTGETDSPLTKEQMRVQKKKAEHDLANYGSSA